MLLKQHCLNLVSRFDVTNKSILQYHYNSWIPDNVKLREEHHDEIQVNTKSGVEVQLFGYILAA